ncbi:hypothetical protein [Colwellia sp. BRX8-9]|jgi:hypothetical protein|uniref:hypothetical protein n=1 Tax=Colwellia sp. BRX8-9 TaxID=2759831 RepID=UPI0015F380BE|nr:hypothetical protein [Colwellia sp. BRX8-9]MBA6350062.1 hypothetical protein [Colwellia sp. BRX8-9]
MRYVLDLNSLKLIEISIDRKFVVSEFVEPGQQSKIYVAIERLKAKLMLSNSKPVAITEKG